VNRSKIASISFLCLVAPLAATMFCSTPGDAADNHSCKLNSAGSNIKHVIYLQFDNVHLTRDNPSVPSDLEQMPHLYDF